MDGRLNRTTVQMKLRCQISRACCGRRGTPPTTVDLRDFRNTSVDASVSGFRFTRWENEKETKASHRLVTDLSPVVPRLTSL